MENAQEAEAAIEYKEHTIEGGKLTVSLAVERNRGTVDIPEPIPSEPVDGNYLKM